MDATPDVARFRYPCTGFDGEVTFERVSGGCAPDQGRDDLATGVVREVRIVDGRGFVLDATIWLPDQALHQSCRTIGVPACAAPANVRTGQPSVVFHNGLASRQDHYFWFATALARAGYVVLTYDRAGQGSSEGTALDVFANHGDCSGSCLDAQDVHRWWTGGVIEPVNAGQQRPFVPPHDPATIEAGGDNVANPYLPALDLAQVAISGNSLGAGATVTYLNAMTDGHGYDGTPVPAVAAAVPLSIPGETRVSAPVPFLTVSGDLDGLPLVAPALLGAGWGDDAERMYATLRGQTAPQSAVGVIIIEGGMHTDHIDQPPIGSTRWGLAVTERYAIPWLDCHVRGKATRCAALGEASPHLSRAYASQIDLDGSGPQSNICLQAPDQASLGQEPEVLLAALGGRHARCEI
jgi:pimeloyl-ACP methyl ester carboxylesterase